MARHLLMLMLIASASTGSAAATCAGDSASSGEAPCRGVDRYSQVLNAVYLPYEEAMHGEWIRCAACTDKLAVCWRRKEGASYDPKTGEDKINTVGEPDGEPPPAMDDIWTDPGWSWEGGPDRQVVRVPEGYDPCLGPVPPAYCFGTPPPSEAVPDCAKGIGRDKCPVPPPGASASLKTMIATLDRCLREESDLAYYVSPTLATYGGTVTLEGSTIAYNPTFLEQQQPYKRAFWLAGAFGAHVVALERQRYGDVRTPGQFLGEGDVIAGFLAHCLVYRRLLPQPVNNAPDDPRLQYESFLRDGFALPGDPPGVSRGLADWEWGWKNYGMGLPREITHR